MTAYKRKSVLPLYRSLAYITRTMNIISILNYGVNGILLCIQTNRSVISYYYLRKELDLLQKLYGLYNAVMSKISGYYGILWTDVDIEKINGELLEFQNR